MTAKRLTISGRVHGVGYRAWMMERAQALGSLALGLALADGALTAEGAHKAAILDETFQEEFWGTDAEALARRRRIGDDIAVAARFLELLRA